MIVRNEEANLPACLASVAGLFEEMIVVDTGSTDGTKAVAIAAGARVFDFPWCDHFAAARNESLRHSSNPWIFWMDADDRLDAANRDRVKDRFAHLPEDNVAFMMRCLCLEKPGGVEGIFFEHVRLFRNHPQIRWQYRIHEQILPAIRRLGGHECPSDVVIHHEGYHDSTLGQHKSERNLRLLLKENAENPDDPFVLFNLGVSYQMLGRLPQAVPFWQRGLAIDPATNDYAAKMFSLLAQALFALGNPAESLKVSQAGRVRYPKSMELLFTESIIETALGHPQEAENCLLGILQFAPGQLPSGEESAIRSYKARNNLAYLYFELGRFSDAEHHWRIVLADRPACEPAWTGLAKLYAVQGRSCDLDLLRDTLGKPQ